MDIKRAADYLRDARAGNRELREAEELGAQALEAWAWLLAKERQESGVTFSESYGWRCHVWAIIGHGDTPLAAVLDAMEKEAANGR